MRKIILLVATVFMALGMQAQIQKKSVLLGGNAGVYYQQSSPNNATSNSSLQPFVQFAYQNNRTIGFNFDLGYNSQKTNDGQSKTQQFTFGPAIHFTQYFPLKGSFGWWLQEELGARFSQSKNTNGANEQKSDATSITANVIPGLYYAAGEKKNWLLQASIGGIGASYSGSNGVDSWSFGSSLFQYYRFGFAYVFKK